MVPADPIETRRLLLRRWRPDDAESLQDVLAESREALERWTPWVLSGTASPDDLREKLRGYAAAFAGGTEWRYAILSREDSCILGGVSLHPRVGPETIEIGYWIATSATGHGYATEAAAALTAEAFRMPGIERVEIRCVPANAASMRVPQRLGFSARSALVHVPPSPGRPGADVVVWERRTERQDAAAAERPR